MTAGYVTVSLCYYREEGQWLGECLELGTATFAESLEQCQEGLEELVVVDLEVLEEIGERERFFQQWGIVAHPTRETPEQLTIRGSGEAWDRLFEDAKNGDGPFLTIRVFSLDAANLETLHPANL